MMVGIPCQWNHLLMTMAGILSSQQHISAVDVKLQRENYVPDYRVYHNLSSIELQLKQIASKYSDIIYLDSGFQSRNGLSQLLIRISNFSMSSSDIAESAYPFEFDASEPIKVPKVCVLLSYGEHAREFFPVETFLYLLKNLTEGITSKEGSFEKRYSEMILSHFDIYAIVMANPDGRRHVELTNNYCWRGTSTGVDINRNFDWQFAQKGSSSDPKDEEFRGPFPFSEPECIVYRALAQRRQLDAFFSFHSGARHIYLPFSDTASKALKREPHNFHHMLQLASRLSVATKYQFRYGTAYNLSFYTADGTAFDYMAGFLQIPFSLAVEMWENTQHKGLSCFDEFNPDNDKLLGALYLVTLTTELGVTGYNCQAEVEALHPLYVELFSHLSHWKRMQHQQQYRMRPLIVDVPSIPVNYVFLVLVLFVSLAVAYRNRQNICAAKRRIMNLPQLRSTFTLGRIFKIR